MHTSRLFFKFSIQKSESARKGKRKKRDGMPWGGGARNQLCTDALPTRTVGFAFTHDYSGRREGEQEAQRKQTRRKNVE